MTTLLLSARDVRERDVIVTVPTSTEFKGTSPVARATHTLGTTYLWLEADAPVGGRPADYIFNHGDPVKVTRDPDFNLTIEDATPHALLRTFASLTRRMERERESTVGNNHPLRDQRDLVELEILRRINP